MYTVCMNIDDIENTLKQKLTYAPPLGVKFKFDFGDEGILLVDGTQNPATVSREDTEADTTFVCSAEMFASIATGAQDPTMAFMTGKLKVQGSMGNALKLASLLED